MRLCLASSGLSYVTYFVILDRLILLRCDFFGEWISFFGCTVVDSFLLPGEVCLQLLMRLRTFRAVFGCWIPCISLRNSSIACRKALPPSISVIYKVQTPSACPYVHVGNLCGFGQPPSWCPRMFRSGYCCINSGLQACNVSAFLQLWVWCVRLWKHL
ncbi:hypothetical protein SynTAK9802_00188 [Synechococcus sp. TAK9802]|nr:hypothetical protein SynTAK9802_00188 [Synechococcus sp. TAK9802]